LPIIQMDAIRAARNNETANSYLKAQKSEWLETAYGVLQMLNEAGIPQDEAAGRAAVWLDKKTDGRLCYKASTFSKMYSDKYKPRAKAGPSHFPALNCKTDEYKADLIARMRADYPDVGVALKGTRR